MNRAKIFPWMKRLLSLALVLSVLAGCSGFSFNLGGEPVTLRFVYLESVADYESLAKIFHEQNPHITVELDPVPLQGNAGQALTGKLAEANAVRLPFFGVDPDLADTFLPLDSQISTNPNFPHDDLFPHSLDGLKLDGKQLGIPAGLNPLVMYYLPEKFQAAGVQPPLPAWTLEDFVTTAAAVHQVDDSVFATDRFAYGFCSHPDLSDGAIFTYLFGGGLFDDLYQVSAPTLNQPANVDALVWYASLKNDFGFIPDKPDARIVGELIGRAQCVFWMDWLDRSTFGNYNTEDAVPLPLPSYNRPFNVAVQDGYFILADSEHPEETWKWIQFLMGQQAASGLYIPPLQSQVSSSEYAARAPQAVVSVARSLTTETIILGLEMSRNQRFGQVLELFSQASNDVFDGTMDGETALDAAQEQAVEAFR